MKKKMKYLIILLTAILMVACTDVEDAAISDVETIPQDIPTESNLNTEKEEANPTIVAEPVIEEISTQPNEDLFSGYKLIEVDGVICPDIVNLTWSLTLVTGNVNIGHLRMNTGS